MANDMWDSIYAIDYLYSILIYATIMIGRYAIFSSINVVFIKLDMYVPTKSETIICCWGALRGAVGLGESVRVVKNEPIVSID